MSYIENEPGRAFLINLNGDGYVYTIKIPSRFVLQAELTKRE